MANNYITFFDLFGTKGACEDSELYFNNICAFEKAIKDTSWLLKDEKQAYGKVGMFSDSAYAESSDLQYLLDFLVILRNRLMSENLFFNAVVKVGELGVDPIEHNGEDVAFGVSFKRSDIAELYIAQTRFKGVGIFLDSSVHEDIKNTTYKMNDCIYIDRKTENSCVSVVYKDIAFEPEGDNKKGLKELWRGITQTMYTSYMRSPKFGSYYISLLSNIIRSYTENIDWDLKQHEFVSQTPLPFLMVNKMISDCYSDISGLPGIEYLALVLLDVVYNSEDLDDYKKRDITMKFAKYECIKHRWLHTLNEIPYDLFSGKNREIFISYCQDEMSDVFVNNIIG